MVCNAICFMLGLALNSKFCSRPTLVLNCLELTSQEDANLDEADPKLVAQNGKWTLLSEGVNFKRFFVSAY
jgi:hypothetical protein